MKIRKSIDRAIAKVGEEWWSDWRRRPCRTISNTQAVWDDRDSRQ